MILTYNAYAKINLFLGVEPITINGKHQLLSVFCTVGLHDTLEFNFAPSGAAGKAACTLPVTVDVSSADGLALPATPAADNSVCKAVWAFQSLYRQRYGADLPASGLHVRLTKRIPAQAGLGGGSSDAAAALTALAALCRLDPKEDAALLEDAARQVGADVPFFLQGGCTMMGGAGDRLIHRLPSPDPPLCLVLAQPQQGISTAAAYRAYDASPVKAAKVKPLLIALEAGQQLQQQHLTNNLEPAALRLCPQVAEVKAGLASQSGVTAAQLSGSGSVVFGVCTDMASAAAAAEAMRACGLWAHPCQTVAAPAIQAG